MLNLVSHGHTPPHIHTRVTHILRKTNVRSEQRRVRHTRVLLACRRWSRCHDRAQGLQLLCQGIREGPGSCEQHGILASASGEVYKGDGTEIRVQTGDVGAVGHELRKFGQVSRYPRRCQVHDVQTELLRMVGRFPGGGDQAGHGLCILIGTAR